MSILDDALDVTLDSTDPEVYVCEECESEFEDDHDACPDCGGAVVVDGGNPYAQLLLADESDGAS